VNCKNGKIRTRSGSFNPQNRVVSKLISHLPFEPNSFVPLVLAHSSPGWVFDKLTVGGGGQLMCGKTSVWSLDKIKRIVISFQARLGISHSLIGPYRLLNWWWRRRWRRHGGVAHGGFAFGPSISRRIGLWFQLDLGSCICFSSGVGSRLPYECSQSKMVLVERIPILNLHWICFQLLWSGHWIPGQFICCRCYFGQTLRLKNQISYIWRSSLGNCSCRGRDHLLVAQSK